MYYKWECILEQSTEQNYQMALISLRWLKTNFDALKLKLERYVYDLWLCEMKLCIVGVSPPPCPDFSEYVP